MTNYLFSIVDRGVQMSGYFDHQTGKFVYVDDMEPELVVPDLTDFKVNFKLIFPPPNYRSLAETLCLLQCDRNQTRSVLGT